MDIKEIQNLIKFVAKSGATEVKLEMDDFKITIKTTPEGAETTYIQQMPMTTAMPMMAQPTATQPEHVVAEVAPAANENANLIVVKSPMIGTFYRKPSPDKPSFAEVGSTIKAGDVLCVIEAMKLFNEIESEVSGKIVKVLIDDASPVEFDQPLFLVDPS
ncbi:acetyl-CoA carboxylase biotin carboxyl carrier protein [Flavobacterium agricola]|uniref:Biotin carboxyl carrier protein of acetyl-CoA carboxylase n=1 Tax=Flavobacterium agricola TaxID=2870839 RepID=A0ABY6M2P7_9FLAO|nr:acetyl-CoA carboxylase biotin carboxyl carrier protein [Flavobacterium agricola]UYW01193.1 acetyl-CoA carboxylase biotin carboxyl carrier protein [Flavobacterium agricola]